MNVNTEMRWLPMMVDEQYEVNLGPAVKDLKDAMDWAQLDSNGSDEATTEHLVWREPNPGAWEAMPSTGLRYEILPVQVQV